MGEPCSVAAESHHETLPLEDPERALDHFYQTIGADLKEIPQARNARMEARYEFAVDLQEVTWWKRLFGRRMIRVARPYL